MSRTTRRPARRRLVTVIAALVAAILAASGTFATLLTITASNDASGADDVPECQTSAVPLQVDSDAAVYDPNTGTYTIPGVTVSNIQAGCHNAGLGLYLTAATVNGDAQQSVGPIPITAGSHHFDFTVGAVSVEGLESWIAAIHPISPSTPFNLAASAASATSVSLTWTAPDAPADVPITDYQIEYSSDSGDTWNVFNDGVSAATSATVTGLTTGTTYQFRVAAINAGGTSPASGEQTVDLSTPPAPTGLQASTVGSSVALSWDPVTAPVGAPITDYQIEVTSDGGNNWTVFNDGVSTTRSATVTGLLANTPYQFRVSSVNAVGAGTPTTATSPAITLPATPPPAVDNLAATAGVTSAAITWSAPQSSGTQAAPTGYVIRRSTNNITWSQIGTTDAATLTYTATELTPGVTYYFQVFATSSAGNGAIAPSVSAVPLEPEPIPPPPDVVLTLDRKVTATLTWTGGNDMDLMTIGPTGEQIGWFNTTGDEVGYLEVDQIPVEADSDPPTPESAAKVYVENIYYENNALDGEYQFWLNRYTYPDGYWHPGNWTYTIRINGVIAWQESGSLATHWESTEDVDWQLYVCTPDFVANTCEPAE